MSKKALLSLALFAIYTGLAVAGLYIAAAVFDDMWICLGVGGALYVITTLLGIFVHNLAIYIPSYIINGASAGVVMNTLFLYLGETPMFGHAAIVFAALVVWYMIFCFLAKAGAVRHHPKLFILLWSLLLIGAALGLALYMQQPAGWLMLMLCAPFVSYIIAFGSSADGPTDLFVNCVSCSSAFALVFAIIGLYIINPVTSGDRGTFVEFDDEPFEFEESSYDSDDDGQSGGTDKADAKDDEQEELRIPEPGIKIDCYDDTDDDYDDDDY